ncbi:hypothetical protein LCGC14_1925580 [marine sediment metagenome]|uniref:Uncharacterized protein n=1 Tax=marine sediment metagenome TaxID=412755 RepID=A0A0F9I3A5_9ZZZZ
MSGVNRIVTKEHGFKSETRAIKEEFNKLIADLERMRAYVADRELDSVVNVEFVASAGCGLAAHATPEDLQTTTVVVASYKGEHFSVAADVAAVVATILGTGNTIGVSQFGCIWVFGNKTANIALAVPSAAETELTDIAALAQLMPTVPTEGDVPIACLMIEADASEWEWGHASNGRIATDSATATFYDLLNRPYITSAMASFALDTGAATFTYGAAVAVLGDGTALAITGKATVAFPAGEVTAIVSNKVGAFILYALANDDEIPVQIGAAYATIQAARLAVDNLNPNPLLVELGRIYIENGSGADFTPGTTLLDATGVTVTFETAPVRAGLLAPTDLTAATVNA